MNGFLLPNKTEPWNQDEFPWLTWWILRVPALNFQGCMEKDHIPWDGGCDAKVKHLSIIGVMFVLYNE